MGNKGYISLHRQILDNEIWNIKPYSKGQAWVTILLLTNHKVGYMPIKNGQLLKVERGECGYSDTALADIFGWSRAKVKRFLTLLETQKMIQLKNRCNRNIISILNYDFYQNSTVNVTVNSTVNEHLTLQQTNTNNNENNENNENNNIYINKEKKLKFGEFKNVLLSDKEYKSLEDIYKNKLNDAIETLSNYLKSKGDKYKNHYAVLRKNNWVYEKIMKENNQFEEKKQQVDEEYNFGIG